MEAHTAPQRSIEAFIDQLPVSDYKKGFLRRYPMMLSPERADIMRRVHAEALAQGVRDDSPEMDMKVIAGVEREMSAPSRASGGPALEPRRRSVPIAAPISREVPSVRNGSRVVEDTRLSPVEREIAHVSFPHLPKDQAEYQYFLNRKRMNAMKASGEIQS